MKIRIFSSLIGWSWRSPSIIILLIIYYIYCISRKAKIFSLTYIAIYRNIIYVYIDYDGGIFINMIIHRIIGKNSCLTLTFCIVVDKGKNLIIYIFFV